MRALFVNPTKRRKKVRRRRKAPMARTRTRRRVSRRAAPVRRRRTTRRRRRRNAGIVPFVQNPLILNNPRRRRRSNPRLRLSVQQIAGDVLAYGGGSAIGAAVNIMGINRIENVWARNGTRIGAAVLAGMLPALMGTRGRAMEKAGAAAAGALMYPVWQEVALQLLAPPVAAAETEADLDMLAADLESALDAW